MSVQQETSAHKISERNTGAQFLVVQNKNECATSSIIETKNGRLYVMVNPHLLLLRKSQDLPHYVQGLIIYNNKLYAYTFFALYEWNGVDTLVQKSQPLPIGDGIVGLIIYNNKLYAGGRRCLYEWDGVGTLVQKSQEVGWISAYVVHGGRIYAVENWLWEWNGINAFVAKGQLWSSYFTSGITYNGKLYIFTNGILYEWNGVDALIQKSPAHLWARNFFVFNNNIFIWIHGGLFQWDGINAFISKSQFFNTMAYHITYNNKLYIFTDRILYEWNGVDALIQKSQLMGDNREIGYLIIRNNRFFITQEALYEWTGLDMLILKSNQRRGYLYPIFFNEILFAITTDAQAYFYHLTKYNHYIAPP